jgi:hypothetical protein
MASDEKGPPMQHRDRRNVARDRIIAAEMMKLELRKAQARPASGEPGTAEAPDARRAALRHGTGYESR